MDFLWHLKKLHSFRFSSPKILPLGHNLGRVHCAAKLEFRSFFMLRDGGKPQARYKHANNGELGARLEAAGPHAGRKRRNC
jgi:hypothetical protein